MRQASGAHFDPALVAASPEDIFPEQGARTFSHFIDLSEQKAAEQQRRWVHAMVRLVLEDQRKIDQRFVRDITTDPNDAALVQTMVAMTDALGLNVIAEGVPTREQKAFLEQRGCHAFEGYLLVKPMPLEQFEADVRPQH